MEFIDCHCHVADNFFFREIENFVEEWRRNKITKIGLMATNLKTTKRNIDLVRKYPDLFVASAGRHPWGAHKWDISERDNFEQIIQKAEIKVIGEIGLDHYFVKEEEKYNKQKEVLEFFLTQANKVKKPVMLHTTGAEKEILDILTTFELKVKICCHWYSGPIEIFQKLKNLGCYFSINPSFLGSKNHSSILNLIPKEKLLTESDGPVKFQNEKGSPSLMPFLCKKISEVLKQKQNNLKKQIFLNYQAFLQ